MFASSATLSLAYIVIFAWFDIVAFAREISWVSRMDHPSVDTMFNYHILILIFISKYKKIEKNGLRLEA